MDISEKYQRYLNTIYDDVIQAHLAYELLLFWYDSGKIEKISENASNIPREISLANEPIKTSLQASLIICLGRANDDTSGVVSIPKFLTKVKGKKPSLIFESIPSVKEYFSTLDQFEESINKLLSKFDDHKKKPFVENTIKKARNLYVAHNSEKLLEDELPTYKDIFDCYTSTANLTGEMLDVFRPMKIDTTTDTLASYSSEPPRTVPLSKMILDDHLKYSSKYMNKFKDRIHSALEEFYCKK